jgi:hypothetical protein
MKIPFFRYRIDWNDPQSIRENATRVRSAEGAWPLRGGPRRTPEENRARLERMRRMRAMAFPPEE